MIDQIRERIDNLVCVEWSMDGVDSVGFNRHEAAWKAATHLVEKGFRRLRYIGPNDERVAGFRQAILEASIPVHPDDVRLSSNAPGGYRVCRESINADDVAEAYLGGTDEVSFGILRVLSAAGRSVPGDVSLVSIDNIEMSEFSSPPLTTVNVDTWEMGRMAVQALMRRAGGAGSNPPVSIQLPTNLVLRGSCL